ncbi:hypothetical protein GLOIN_2v473602 [Rhizophagus clarus]|uniref:DUF659 domain-containing protein n=1 Tax=Rhizophagus clarus TaxID=94130 RepID=A0A8H3QMU6_9GLOM|nr:hypothetical protein GLOIN_2v473602 [Rhizophagus clarus]
MSHITVVKWNVRTIIICPPVRAKPQNNFFQICRRFPSIPTKYIVKTKEKASNIKTFCKACVEVLGEEEGREISFSNKTDQMVNKPEAKKLFEFLNPFLKLPDRRVLGGDILDKIVAELNDAMETSLIQKTLWLKAVDISSERENYIEKMLEDLKKKEITVCAIVTDSASAYAAARYDVN